MKLDMILGTQYLDSRTTDLINTAIENNLTAFDTADCYGAGASEAALGLCLQQYDRSKLYVGTKCGVQFVDGRVIVDSSKDYILAACQASLNRLKTDYVDIYYLHRLDQVTPIETSMMAMQSLLEQGLIKSVGLSEVTAEQIRRAHNIHSISAVQCEYSPWSRHDEKNNVIPTCRELNIQITAYSPLGRGLFTNVDVEYFQNLPDNHYTKILPRYKPEAIKTNMQKRAPIEAYAKQKNCTVAQLTLAWIISKNIIPIFGVDNQAQLTENLCARNINLTNNELTELQSLFAALDDQTIDRYPGPEISGIFTE